MQPFAAFPSVCVYAKLLQSCPTLCDPMDWRPPGSSRLPGSSVHGILQARIIFPTQGSNPDLFCLSYIGRLVLYHLCHLGVQFSHSVMSDSLRPHGLQHASPPCPSPTRGACSNSCPSNQWYHPTISLSVPFSSCLQSFPASGSFPMSPFFTSGGLSIVASASASFVPVNVQGWFSLRLRGLISLHSKGLWRVFSSTTVWKHQFFCTQPSLLSNCHIHTWLLVTC